MPKICYVEKRFTASSQAIIDLANSIIAEYTAQGYDLTLRQLYYQFVARDHLANSQRNYKRLGNIINDARLAGLIDWDSITDRTRGLEALSCWDTPASIVDACASQFRLDRWATQPYAPEVWIEKEALAGVFERVCNELRVPYLSCRGYTSQSEAWRAAMRLKQKRLQGKKPIVFHFGDHDPSGMDMSRDIQARFATFGVKLEFHRLALNMDQVEEHEPPPNPAKTTDSRYEAYIAQYGYDSWELDALEPGLLAGLVRSAIEEIIQWAEWIESVAQEDEDRRLLGRVAENWNEITENL